MPLVSVVSRAKPWKEDRLYSREKTTKEFLDGLGLEYRLSKHNGLFRIDVGEPVPLQYYCSTGAWGWEEEGVYKVHYRETTLKRFYENVLSNYVAVPLPWKDVKV